MRVLSDFGLIAAFLLITVLFALALAVAVGKIRVRIRAARIRRTASSFVYHAASDGSTHAVPAGQLHDSTAECPCRPLVQGMPRSLVLTHRDLNRVRR